MSLCHVFQLDPWFSDFWGKGLKAGLCTVQLPRLRTAALVLLTALPNTNYLLLSCHRHRRHPAYILAWRNFPSLQLMTLHQL